MELSVSCVLPWSNFSFHYADWHACVRALCPALFNDERWTQKVESSTFAIYGALRVALCKRRRHCVVAPQRKVTWPSPTLRKRNLFSSLFPLETVPYKNQAKQTPFLWYFLLHSKSIFQKLLPFPFLTQKVTFWSPRHEVHIFCYSFGPFAWSFETPSPKNWRIARFGDR